MKLLVINKQNLSESKRLHHNKIGMFLLGRRISNYLIIDDITNTIHNLDVCNASLTEIDNYFKKYYE